ncbi:hypothetical protein C427_4824 [Paraglaciecola psychrophila 170]|jgi:hypothetical protein|uniref:Uncharacterized protein n=2 Tax=Paraglaciecola TaxID=1621534 RepID=K6ZVP2_9ALTE|nr:hypothetical protein C427_4824 [Paraglaciecola psychrophila 170]GAC39956.1 hypothetical protein GPSY_4353 [Paraglaciecola psychrophila 170]
MAKLIFIETHMKILFFLTLVLCSSLTIADSHYSYSEIKIGVENISYAEKLSNVAGLGQLSQSIDVTNPTIRQISYSGINDSWGFYIETASSISTEIATEQWSMDTFGEIQTNAFKIKANEISMKTAYNWNNALQFTWGAQIYTSSFTRSNFAFSQPGAQFFDDALIDLPREDGDDVPRYLLPSQSTNDAQTPQQALNSRVMPVVSVSEDQVGISMSVGARYDTINLSSIKKLSWYLDGEVILPAYTQVQNTQFETTTLSKSFNGWGVNAELGLRYHFTKTLAWVFAVDALYTSRDTITENLSNGRRLIVPKIEYSNISISSGLHWAY